MSVCAVLVVFLITWPSIQFKHSSKVRNTHNSSLITHHSSMFFSPSELQRYDRHFKLPQFGMEAQQRLKAARVLVIGAGGLGSPLLQYLAAAGVGVIGIVDGDVVDRSNLQRQVLFDEHDIGRAKTDAAAERLQALNPHVQIQLHPVFLRSDNALDIIGQYDVVADGSDNFPTRYLVNDACVLAGKPLVYGAVSQFEGQVSVFNWMQGGAGGPNYRDLFPVPPPPGSVPDCSEGGVLGVLPGIIGSMQALEALKIISETGTTLSGYLFVLDALKFETHRFRIRSREDNPLTGIAPTITELIDYEAFCGLSNSIKEHALKEISAHQFLAWRQSGEIFQLIDVREAHEYAEHNLGGDLIPLAEVAQQVSRISRTLPVVVHCRSGARSAQAIRLLEEQFGFENLYNLTGGMLAVENIRTNEGDFS